MDQLKYMLNRILNKKKTISNLDNEKELIDSFNNLYFNSQVWKNTYWMGTEIQKAPVADNFGDGPYEAVNKFITINKEFIIDRSREKHYLTFCPCGFLKRVK
jgi:cephalosporin hydroxylase